MIRRYYILPLRHGVGDEKVREMIDVLRAADQFIPGLRDASAGLDLDSRTVVWENTFVDEASYSGPYMVHPFHIGAIDNYVMADSPECITRDIYATRFTTDDATQQVRKGIRRVVLCNAESDADAAALAELTAAPDGMAASAFGADNVGWVSAKGRPWTHIWEQVFADEAQLAAYVHSRDGIACSSLEGFTRLGIDLSSVKVFTFPLDLTTAEQQTPGPTPADDRPVLHTITARLALDDVEPFVALLEQLYDPFMLGCGSPLVQRSCTADRGYLEGEVQSTWHLDSLAAYSPLRAATYADPGWNDFVRDAMPMVRGGARRFHHVR